MTTIAQSKLGQKHSPIAREMDTLLLESQKLGAIDGAQRLELICDQYNQLSPNTAYLWLDPGAFQNEIEEAQAHKFKVEAVHFGRNFFSLAPLIMTWYALFVAVSSYQKYISLPHSNDKPTAFLELWQGGFGGITGLTFTVAAGTDVALLLIYLGFVLLTHEMERRAHVTSVQFVKKLQGKVDELIKYIIADTVSVGSQTDIDRVITGVKQVVDSATTTMTQIVEKMSDSNKQAVNALEQSVKTIVTDAQTSIQQVSEASTRTITDANKQVEALFNSQIIPMMKTFNNDMGTLHQELGNYQGRLNDLTSASQQLATASKQLANASSTLTDNAERYVTIGEDIGTQIAVLNGTQDKVLQQIEDVAGGITTVASHMNTTTTDMRLSIDSVKNVAQQLDKGLRVTIDTMTDRVSTSTNALAQVGPQLYETSVYLQQAAVLLSGTKQKKKLGPVKRLTRQLFGQPANTQGVQNP